MSAVVSDRMSGDKHNPNVELIGQGVANVLSPLFGRLPATGAIARTATNIRSGAKTPVSAQCSSGRYDSHRFAKVSYPSMLSVVDGEQIS